MDDIPPPVAPGSGKLLDRIRADMRARGYAYATERTYLHWIKRFIFHHRYRHPADMGKGEIEAFLNHLTVGTSVAPATQRIALNALVYLYTKFLRREPQELSFNYARPTRRLPSVLTHEEVQAVLAHMSGTPKLMVEILYGSGLRLQECITLRVKDIDFALHTITVRQGKGDKDRTTILPRALQQRLHNQVAQALALHRQDIADGLGEVYLPYALERKYPGAARRPGWQYLFPSSRISADPRSGIRRRHHVHHTLLRKHLNLAVAKANIHKPVKTHTFRHSFATRLLQKGYDIRTIQKLLGLEDVTTTEIYTHVLNRGAMGVISPVDD